MCQFVYLIAQNRIHEGKQFVGDADNSSSTSAAIIVTALNSGDAEIRNDFEMDSPFCPIE
jgi:hypothetical protein